MAIQSFMTPARIGAFKGGILKAAKAFELLVLQGRQVDMPKNNSDTYKARRFLPFGATAANQNVFYQNATGDRERALTQAHLTAEGITSAADSMTPVDVTEVIQQYSCLYGFTDKTFDLYEDDIPAAIKKDIGHRTALVNEAIVYGKLKSCTNQFFGGAGTTRATVAGPMTLNLQSAIVRGLLANHCMPVTEVLAASADFGTSAVEPGYFAYVSTDCERMIRDLPNFVPASKYANGKPMAMEIGTVERIRYILSPDLIAIQDGGAAIANWTGSGTGFSTTGTSLDVYPIIYLGAEAFSQIAVKGMGIDPTFIPTSEKTKADPHGQRGYAGAKWYKAVMIENNGWMAVAFVARPA